MRNGLAFLLLGLTALGLGTASCGSDEATSGGTCKSAGQSYQVVASVQKGSCCAGLSPQCNVTPMTDPNTGITQSNGTCTCTSGGILGGGGAGGSLGGSAGSGGTAARGGTGTGGTGGTAMSAALGRNCTQDSQCGAGLVCLTSDGLANGGPANGLCTVACTTDSQCLEISSSSFCVGFSETESYCLQACTTGSLGVPKCQQRPDVSCTLIGLVPTGPACETSAECGVGQLCSSSEPSQCGDIVTGCVPTCGGDYDCGAGQFCDFGSGLCTNTEPAGLPIGAECTPPATDADEDPCQGFCLASDDARTEGTCTAFCTFNSAFTGCGWDGVAKAEAGCLYSTILSQGDLAPGDVGICGSLCDCNADCALDSERCVDETGTQIMQIFNRQGYCRPLDTANGETEADTFSMCPGGAGTGGTGGSGDAGQGGA